MVPTACQASECCQARKVQQSYSVSCLSCQSRLRPSRSRWHSKRPNDVCVTKCYAHCMSGCCAVLSDTACGKKNRGVHVCNVTGHHHHISPVLEVATLGGVRCLAPANCIYIVSLNTFSAIHVRAPPFRTPLRVEEISMQVFPALAWHPK